MALQLTEQIKHLFEEKKHILLTFREGAGSDALASALALKTFLEKKKKQVEIVSTNFVLPKKLAFLPLVHSIQNNFPHLQKFTLSLDVKDAGLKELSYEVKDGTLNIHITPNHGSLTKEHIKTSQTEFRYDLIVTLDTPDLPSLGHIFHRNSEFFYRTPLINIDSSPANEQYGSVNRIDITASTTSEVVAHLIQEMDDTALDAEIATSLLTGMVAATQSFKTKNVKPQTLALASKLVELGADREYIIEQLYRTKSLSTLKLWGQALTHLEYVPKLRLVTSLLTREEMVRSDATETELYDIVDELITNSPEAHIILLLHEAVDGTGVRALLHCSKEYNAIELAAPFGGQGGKNRVAFALNLSLKEAEHKIIEHLEKILLK